MPYGRTLLTTDKLFPTRVSADGRPEYKVGGITIDLATIPTAPVADVTLPDGSTIRAGNQYLRHGQVLCRIGVAEIQAYTWTGGPTAGSAILTLPASGEYAAQSTSALAFNASSAVVQAALEALPRIGSGNVTVARTGTGIAGDPYIYTAAYNKNLGDLAPFTATHTFTGGTTPTVTVATITGSGTTSGKYGPYDPAATDGRQTLTRGDCYILDEVYLVNPNGAGYLAGLGSCDIIGNVLQGGEVWIDRVLHSGTTAGTLALGPTLANLLTAFPRLTLVRN